MQHNKLSKWTRCGLDFVTFETSRLNGPDNLFKILDRIVIQLHIIGIHIILNTNVLARESLISVWIVLKLERDQKLKLDLRFQVLQGTLKETSFWVVFFLIYLKKKFLCVRVKIHKYHCIYPSILFYILKF